MKKLILILAAISATALAAPAMAQQGRYDRDDQRYGYDDNRNDRGVENRIERIGQRLERGIQRGAFDRRETYRLRTDYRTLINLEARYERGGLTRWENDDLRRRAQLLNQSIRTAGQNGRAGWDQGERWDDDDRYDRNDRNDRDGRYDRDDRDD